MLGQSGREPRRVEITLRPAERTPIFRGDGHLTAHWLEDKSGVLIRGEYKALSDLSLALHAIPIQSSEVHTSEGPEGELEVYIPNPHPLRGDDLAVYLREYPQEQEEEPVVYLVLGFTALGWEIVATPSTPMKYRAGR